MEATTTSGSAARRTRLGSLRLLVSAALAAAAAVAALPGAAQPALPGLNGKIAFEGTDQNVWVMEADGSSPQQLTTTGGWDPAWSPDGQRLAFTLGQHIYVMDADGSNVRQVTDGGTSGSPAWSPDGQKIAFERVGSRSEIFVVNADGSNPTQLTDGVAGSGSGKPAWSPDGERLAFENGFDVYVMNADGSNPTRLTQSSGDPITGSRHLGPSWSPDGQRIVFWGWGNGNSVGQIYVMGADGSNQTQLAASAEYDKHPTWSPDGQKIVFDCGSNVCVVNANGSNRTQLLAGSRPDWQRRVAQPTRTATVQQPLDADGSSVFKAGKGVLPVKFALAVDGVPTCTLPPATIALTQLAGANDGAVNEPMYTLAADAGSDFRVDGCQYVYNLSLKSLSAGTYQVEIEIDGTPVGSAVFALR